MTPSVLQVLIAAGRRLRVDPYFVGGPVRDRLLGRACHDWDIVSRKALSLARSAARQTRGKLIVLDHHYRIYRLILSDQTTIDFAEMQGATIREDLGRRDFTINAMAVHIKEGSSVIDLFGGQRDLKRKVVRAVSRKAFREDPLRLLRAFRFAAQFGFSIERQTLKWMAQSRGGLMGPVANERIREEWLRLLQQPAATPSLKLMDKTGLLTAIFPDMETCRSVARRYYGKGGVLKHSLQTVENLEWILQRIVSGCRSIGASAKQRGLTPILPYADTPIRKDILKYVNESMGGFPRRVWLKFAGFLHDIGKPATAQVLNGRLRFFGHEDAGSRMSHRILRDLRCSRQEEHLVSIWVQNHMRPGNLAAASRITDKAVARFFRDLGEEGVGMLLVSLADHYGYLPKAQWGKGKDPVEKTTALLLDAYYNQREKVLPERIINGHTLMKKLRIKPGPMVGKLLNAIQDGQAEGSVTTKEEALDYAKRKLRTMKL